MQRLDVLPPALAPTEVLPPVVLPERQAMVGVSSLLQAFAAQMVDFAAAVAAGALAAAMAMVAINGRWPADAPTTLDALATWLVDYPSCARLGLVAGGMAAVAHAAVGARRGQTLGRRLAGLELTQLDGTMPSWGWAWARAALSLMSALPFGAGYFWTVVDSRGRAWHDLLCQTVLEQQDAARPPAVLPRLSRRLAGAASRALGRGRRTPG